MTSSGSVASAHISSASKPHANEPGTNRRQERQQAFGKWLQAARLTAGLNQKELAEATGAANTQISRYERGTNLPSHDNVLRIAGALDADPAEAIHVAGYAARAASRKSLGMDTPQHSRIAAGVSPVARSGVSLSSSSLPIQIAVANDLASRADLLRTQRVLEEQIAQLRVLVERLVLPAGKASSKSFSAGVQQKRDYPEQTFGHIQTLSEFQQELEAAFYDACERSVSLSLMLIDVDHLKSYNEDCGHHLGDAVLRIVADLLARVARPGDQMARLLEDRSVDWMNRYGDQFALLMPETTADQANKVMQAYQREVKGYEWPCRPVTVTISVATRTSKMLTGRDLLQRAADALDAQRENEKLPAS